MARKKTQAYTEEFRREAVKRAEKDGVTTAQVAKELGISAQQIYNWRRQFNRLSDKQFNSVGGVDYSKQIVVDSSKSSDEEFFPINGNLSFEPEGSSLTIGRNEICDAYRHLCGNLNNGAASGEYFQFGWGRKQLGYFKLRQSAK